MKKILIAAFIFAAPAIHGQQLFSVHFDTDKHQLTNASRQSLDSFIRVNKEMPSMQIFLSGYCDPRGASDYNDRLSERRIASVKQYLVRNGIAGNSFVNEKANGEHIQLNENQNDFERLQNRRVQISFTNSGNAGSPNLKDQLADSAATAGTNIVLRNINFYGGSHQLLPSSTPMLDELVDAMISYPNLAIRIEGHICCEATTGDGLDQETNIKNLSHARAEAIRDYLIEKNIASERVQFKGYGHSAPIYPYPEETEEQRMENRRVEIKILRK